MKLINVADNCPVPRGGTLIEVRTYELPDGSHRTKTIRISGFQGRYSDWTEFVDRQPFDDEK